MSDTLTDRFLAAIHTRDLIIQTTETILPHRPAVRLLEPGPTPRSKPRQLVPLIIADEGQALADLLRMLAQALEQ